MSSAVKGNSYLDLAKRTECVPYEISPWLIKAPLYTIGTYNLEVILICAEISE